MMIKSFFTKNIALKLASLIFAIGVWLVVVNVDNPVQSRNFTSSVVVVNDDVLATQGKYYYIPEGGNTVTFRVSAQRSIIEKLSSEDFSAVADMNDLEGDLRIPVQITALKYPTQVNISAQQQYLNVVIGEEHTREFVIEKNTQGEPATGYVLDEIKCNPEIITVRGPETIVSSIDKVLIDADITGQSSEITKNEVLIFVDEKGERVDTTKLTLSATSVEVNIKFASKKTVPVVIEDADARNENVEITGIDISPARVDIKGESQILNGISEITIPRSVVDISAITQDFQTTVDISTYLPEGVRLVSEDSAQVGINVKVSSGDEKELEVPTEHITIKNLDSAKRLVFDTDTVKVKVTGMPSVLSNITGNDIHGEIDASGLGDGSHSVRVDIRVDDRFNVVVGTARARVTISSP